MNRRFSRKPANLDELKRTNHTDATRRVVIEKYIILPPAQYAAFAADLTEDQEFITAHKDRMHMDDDFTCHCILVKAEGANDGILVESEGYDYPRYAAYWQEVAK